MNNEQATIVRIYEYLLSKDVQIKQVLVDKRWGIQKKYPHSRDIYDYLIACITLEVWEEIAGDIWKLIK